MGRLRAGLDPPPRRLDPIDDLAAEVERPGHLDGPDPHLERQGPAGHVVGRLRGAPGGEPGRVDLPFHHVLQVGPIRLGGEQDPAPGRVGHAPGPEGRIGLADLDARIVQDADHLGRGPRVVLIGRDDPGVGGLVLAPLDRLASQGPVIRLEGRPVPGRQGQERPAQIRSYSTMSRSRHQPPGQGSTKLTRRLMVGEAPGRPAQLLLLQEDRRGQPDARRLGQHADHVVPLRRGPVAAVPPVVVHGVGQDPPLALAGRGRPPCGPRSWRSTGGSSGRGSG